MNSGLLMNFNYSKNWHLCPPFRQQTVIKFRQLQQCNVLTLWRTSSFVLNLDFLFSLNLKIYFTAVILLSSVILINDVSAIHNNGAHWSHVLVKQDQQSEINNDLIHWTKHLHQQHQHAVWVSRFYYHRELSNPTDPQILVIPQCGKGR